MQSRSGRVYSPCHTLSLPFFLCQLLSKVEVTRNGHPLCKQDPPLAATLMRASAYTFCANGLIGHVVGDAGHSLY